MDKPRCQSCGMPLGEFADAAGKVSTNYGTEANGAVATEYCAFCFQNGAFTRPDLTLQGMIDLSVSHMTGQMGFSPAKAEELAQSVIPKLRRWREQL